MQEMLSGSVSYITVNYETLNGLFTCRPICKDIIDRSYQKASFQLKALEVFKALFFPNGLNC